MRYARPPIASLRDPALVAKAWHQRRPCAGDPGHIPARLDRLVGEAKARERRHDDMERVLRPSPVASGIAERADNLHELNDRSRPAVRENDRQSVLMRGPHVDEMNANPVDLCTKLREGVDASLKAPPVIPIAPIGDERLSFGQRHTLGPIRYQFPIRPPSIGESPFEIVQRCLRYIDLEGSDVLCCSGEHHLRSLARAPTGTYLDPR